MPRFDRLYRYNVAEVYPGDEYINDEDGETIDTKGATSLFFAIATGTNTDADFDVTFQGSNDGINFTDLDASTELVMASPKNPLNIAADTGYLVGITAFYRYYRVQLTNNLASVTGMWLSVTSFSNTLRHAPGDLTPSAG